MPRSRCRSHSPAAQSEGRIENREEEQGKTFQLPSLIQTGAAAGMVTMEQSLKSLCERGLVTYEEALEHAFDAHELARLMGRS